MRQDSWCLLHVRHQSTLVAYDVAGTLQLTRPLQGASCACIPVKQPECKPLLLEPS